MNDSPGFRRESSQHPLAPYVDQIDPDRTYNMRDIAVLIGTSRGSVETMRKLGALDGAVAEVMPGGGRMWTWRGSQLVQMASKPLRLQGLDHSKLAPVTLYRVGCGCPACRQAYVDEARERRRALSEERFPAAARETVLSRVWEGYTVVEAAEMAGVSTNQVYRRTEWDADFGSALDEAAWTLCQAGPDSPRCGTAGMYRGLGTGYSPCRGTGCREWRRESSQRNRS